jgi:RNA polymerase sigma-70 factor (ECF subfamily)
MLDSSVDFESLLKAARTEAEPALGDLVGRYRKLLKMLVRSQVQGPMQAKADASDVVQETLLTAVKGFTAFRGSTEAAMIAWLRSILAGQLANLYRHHYAARRTIQLENQLDVELQRSSVVLQMAFPTGPSPSESMAVEERLLSLADAIESLPEHYRTVILLRHVRGERFAEIAKQMGRTRDSVRKLWVRALAQLKTTMEAH